MDRDALIALVVGREVNEQQVCHRLSSRYFVPMDQWTALKAHEQYFLRCYAASAMTSRAVLVGRSAAAVSGMWVLPSETEVVELALPSGKPPAKNLWPAGVVYRNIKVPDCDIESAGENAELRYTNGPRSAIDIARIHGHRDGVVAFDSLLRHGTLKQRREKWKEIKAALARMAGKKWIERARDAFAASTHLSESPFESLMRVILLEHGIEPELQMWIGKYRVDLLWGKVIIEVDGYMKYEDKPHDQLMEQMKRENWLKEQSYEVVRIYPSDILRDPDACIARIRQAKELADERGPVLVEASTERVY
ncbi:DUF559 domain-containing protein [Corynebacterium sp. CNCTC7651]|uniref:endonuclease domain-containing protein n=1 Tax=Corynebacterium sp. CNCTC7651 TaxID=2815361 RepID=UPI001F44A407|nr:DUF559 domain-containing protein [Corynebacterium sp. CNCTC7651]UIZ91938.1 DUF559 domain-containing protein [Corynebacterium sp. CNCTC7651]